MHETSRDVSRREHWTNDGQGLSTYQRAKLGCLQRIADALESIASPNTTLKYENERLRNDNLELATQVARLMKNARRQAREAKKKEMTT